MIGSRNAARVHVSTFAVAALTLVLAAAPLAQAASVGSEMVWAGGVQFKMVIPRAHFPATANAKLDNFYLVAPQTSTPQSTGEPPAPFTHDHVLDAPRQNHGDYNVHWHVFLVLCSSQGMSTGGCVPTMTTTPQGVIPLAQTVNGQMLTSVGPIESPSNSGMLMLIDTGIVFVCPIHASQ